LPETHHALIDSIADWRPLLDAAPQTLIHNDFNPRNVCLRRLEPDPGMAGNRRPDPGVASDCSPDPEWTDRRPDPGWTDRRPDPGAGAAIAGFRLCAFDWELAAIGTPMRDVAEFLCFVAPVDVDRAWIERLIARHATRFAETAGVNMNAETCHAAFAAALAELLVDRLSIYAMVHRVRPQSFLPRVLRTWTALHVLFPVR
jgi:hypothetical protein